MAIELIAEHADLFWGLVASFWVGNFPIVPILLGFVLGVCEAIFCRQR